MLAWLLHRSRDPVVVTERIKMSAGCLNLIAIGLLVGSAIAPYFNAAQQIPLAQRLLAVFGFFLIVRMCHAPSALSPRTCCTKED